MSSLHGDAAAGAAPPHSRPEAVPELLWPALNSADAAAITRALAIGPWLWPVSMDGSAWAQAMRLSGTDAPKLRPGETALLTVTSTSSALWHFQVGARDPHPLANLADLGSVARRAWNTARVAVDRALPLRWGLSGIGDQQLRVTHVRSLALQDGAVARIEPTVDGESFGLAFALALASYILSTPLPENLAASARVDQDGRVHDVDGLDGKVAVLLHAAPRVRRFMVASAQCEAARDIVARAGAASELEVVPVESVATALDTVFGATIAEMLVEAGSTRRSATIRNFFEAALTDRSVFVDWSPLASAANLALRQWTDLDADARFQLEFTRAIAGRHDGQNHKLHMPPADWWSHQPEPNNIRVLAHLVQHVMDTGTPDAHSCIAAAKRHIPSLRVATPDQLHLAGALARLLSTMGDVRAALRRHADLARQYDALMKTSDASYSLTEWFRLAGVGGDPVAYAAAETFLEEHASAFDEYASAYIQLGRARAMTLLGICPEESDRRRWLVLAADPSLPAHLRWSATRWCARASSVFGSEYPFDLVEALRAAIGDRTTIAREATVFALLIEADERAAAGDRDGEADAVAALETLEPVLMGRLRSAAADYQLRVRDLYPY